MLVRSFGMLRQAVRGRQCNRGIGQWPNCVVHWPLLSSIGVGFKVTFCESSLNSHGTL
ncbi:hypothetical protein RB1932 [Rhodopirellula baltica SH 1]|uniref:Uncharacterized protein n=1 Tax=Rhodopirellula baltica (strain DSM 10527 / NCIMB 13988 / SH1) TaxID=243090 RepID=Q7UWM2_RHOBA|nr:hypothetical protein RB1932 [Rhodopirellula baltica SH 1]